MNGKEILNQIRNSDGGAELIARLSHHMQYENPIRRTKRAQIYAAQYAKRHFKKDVEAMIEDFRTNGLLKRMVISYGREKAGF